jgi:hypothetical protein
MTIIDDDLHGRTAVEWVKYAAAVLVAGWVVAAVVVASRWPLVHDAPLMHYVVFLMEHGLAPYRDIVDMNMPGSYIVEWTVMHTLGRGAHAWFSWDVLTGVAAIVASVWIAGPKRRWAGVVGGGLTYLYHLSDGAWNLGQRDWMVAVLLLVAFGFLFACLRTGQAAWVAGFVCSCGLASSIKPLAVLMVAVFLPVLLWLQRGEARKAVATLGWAAVGAVPPALIVVLFLNHWRVWVEYLAILHGLVPYYAGLGNTGRMDLIQLWAPLGVKVMVGAAAWLFWRYRAWRSWESSLLAAGAVCGFAFFVIQRKGWSYHSYTLVAFALLWVMVQVDTALRAKNGLRFVAVGVLVLAALIVPQSLLNAEVHNVYPTATLEELQTDLDQLGGPALSGQVQCLDMTMGGCVTVLLRMQLVQSTGFLYDFYLFPARENSVARQMQQRFLARMEAAPPKVLVLSSHVWPGDTYGYEQVARWPEFKDFLTHKYELGPSCPQRGKAAGFEIFLRK